MKNLLEKITLEYDTYSKTNRRIADYIKSNYSTLSFMTVKDTSKEIGTSTTSIIRFCQSLGYLGYQEFQMEIRDYVQSCVAPMKKIGKLIRRGNGEEPVLKSMRGNGISTLQKTYNEQLQKEFDAAVADLSKAKRIFILGLRASFAVSYYLHFILSKLMDNVTLLRLDEGILYDSISDIGDNDALIVIGTYRYTMTTVDVTEHFNQSGGMVIALTDSMSSPIALMAKHKMIIDVADKTFPFNPMICIIDALTIELGKRNSESSTKRLSQNEDTLIKRNVYYR